MKFTTRVEGESDTGSFVALPTVSLLVPDYIPTSLPQGVYAARANIGYLDYYGIVSYGPDSLTGSGVSLLFFPFDTFAFYVAQESEAAIEIVHFIRENRQFEIPELFVRQFRNDIERARTILKI